MDKKVKENDTMNISNFEQSFIESILGNIEKEFQTNIFASNINEPFTKDLLEEAIKQMGKIEKPKEFIFSDYMVDTKTIQNKTHKKYRTNKKWAKRYGFKTIQTPKKHAFVMGDKIFVHSYYKAHLGY